MPFVQSFVQWFRGLASGLFAMTHQRQPDDNADASDGLIRFSCHHCGKRLKADSKHAGKPAKCSCGSRPLVPFHDVPVFEPASEQVQLPWMPPTFPPNLPSTGNFMAPGQIPGHVALSIHHPPATGSNLLANIILGMVAFWTILCAVMVGRTIWNRYEILKTANSPVTFDSLIGAFFLTLVFYGIIWFIPATVGTLVAILARRR